MKWRQTIARMLLCWLIGLCCHRALVAAEPPAAARPAIVAHRGLLIHSPENTLANFRACLALELGFEFDVRRSKDGALICLHDDTLDRTTNGKGRAADFILEELRKLDAGAWFDKSFAGERIPTVDEIFTLLAQSPAADVLVAVDMKADDDLVEADVVRLAKQHNVLDRLLFIGRTIDQPDVRQRLRAADAGVHVAYLAGKAEELSAALADSTADWAYLRFVPTAEQVKQAQQAGKRVFIAGPTVAGWEPANWRQAIASGLHGMLTDHPLELRQTLRGGSSPMSAEVLWSKLAPYFAPPPEYAPKPDNPTPPWTFEDGRTVTDPSQWPARRQEILAAWHKMMGPWPPLLARPAIRSLEQEHRDNFTQHRVQIDIAQDKQELGYLLVPDGPGPFAAVLVPFYDAETSIGLNEKARGLYDFGYQLARRGFVTLSLRTPGSNEPVGKDTRQALVRLGKETGIQPLSYLAYVAANCHTALAQRPEVDPSRIGVVGLSYGGKWSMFASCLHDKFACAVWSDPGIVFDESNRNINYYEPWYLGFDPKVERKPGVPSDDNPRTGLYKRLIESRRNLDELHVLMAPRPFLVSGGSEDGPKQWTVLNRLVDLNRFLGHTNRVGMTNRVGHIPTPEAAEQTCLFFEYFLRDNK